MLLKVITLLILFLVVRSEFEYVKILNGYRSAYNGTTIEVTVIGVPSFRISHNDGVWYDASFSLMYQTKTVEDYNFKVGGTVVALPSLTWSFTTPIVFNGTLSFNLTASIMNSDASLTFVVKFNSEKKQLKFDTVVTNYDSSWKKNGNYLVLGYKLTVENNSTTAIPKTTYVKKKNGVGFGPYGLFEIVPITVAGTNVTTFSSEQTSTVIVVYDKFTGDMIHDPTISIQTPFGFINFDRETLIALIVILCVSMFVMGFKV
eukprot:gene3518-6165_t